MSEVAKSASKAVRKTETLERQVQLVKSLVEELQFAGSSQFASGAKSSASGDVELRGQVRILVCAYTVHIQYYTCS